MSYSLQFQATDTVAASASLASGATSTTLTSGNFGSPSGVQLYVIDYGIPGTAEIVSATVAGTAMTGITRGLAGGAPGTTNHAGLATVGAFFVPQHYAALADFSGTAAADAWTAWTPAFTGFSASPTVIARYKKIGTLCTVNVYTLSAGTSNSTSFTLTLPFSATNAAANQQTSLIGAFTGGSAIVATAFTSQNSNVLQLSNAFNNAGTANWTATGNKSATFTFTYETA